MLKILSIAIAGALGALSRYGLGGLLHNFLGNAFPYGTLVINVIGCFLIGLVMQISTVSTVIPDSWRIPITVGFLGAFTTFSSFSYETIRLFETNAIFFGLLNIGLNLLIGIAATLAGLWLGKFLVGA